MGVEQESDTAGEPVERRVVGAEDREPESPASRRDRPEPAPWTKAVPLGEVPEDYAARPRPERKMSIPRRRVVALLALFLTVSAVDFIVAAVGDSYPADLPLRFVFGSVMQALGWWTVIHLVRHR